MEFLRCVEFAGQNINGNHVSGSVNDEIARVSIRDFDPLFVIHKNPFAFWIF